MTMRDIARGIIRDEDERWSAEALRWDCDNAFTGPIDLAPLTDAMVYPSSGPVLAPVDLTVESMHAALDVYRRRRDRGDFGPVVVDRPPSDAAIAMTYALGMLRTEPLYVGTTGAEYTGATHLLGFDPALRYSTRRTWTYRHAQRAARKVRQARKRRRGW